MSKKRLDPSTLEVIAETICGGGQGSGGGAAYGSPGPYRSMTEIHAFFARVGVRPIGQSSTRKWFVLEALRTLNDDPSGTSVSPPLERVLLRLADPKEYRGESTVTNAVLEHLNSVLRTEGLQITVVGVQPQLREIAAGIAPPKPQNPPHHPPPDFDTLCGDSTLGQILTQRWNEAQKCIDAGACLSAVIMMGSILEGLLLRKVESDPKTSNQANASPKDKAGKVRPISDWGLSSLIDVAHEVGWLQGDVKRFSHALRDSRNIVHPYVQRAYGDSPDEDTCQICWQVVRAAVADLFNVAQTASTKKAI